MKVRIVVDSSADLRSDIRQRLSVVPLTILFGDAEYIDGVTIGHKEFYEKLVESDVLPTTSQASPHAFAQAFEAAKQAGEEVVCITISAVLSGTFQSAAIAAQDYDNVHVVDSYSVAIGSGILAEYALQLADKGLSAAEIAEELRHARKRVHVIAMLDTLEYLRRGGRISKTAAFAGSLLSIKPVVNVRDGAINILGKARGSKQGNNLLVREIENAGGVDFNMPVLLGYTGMSDALLKKYISDSSALWQDHISSLQTTIVGSVIGTHAGPNAIAVAFFAK